MPTLYLVDSILKNHPNPYKPLFAKDKVIVDMFVHVFSCEREKGRASLYKLRQTWTPLFHNDILLALDKNVKKIDNAWPIQAKETSRNTILVNPNFIKDKKPERSSKERDEDPGSDEDEEMKKMAEQIKELERKKKEMKRKQMQLQIEKMKQEVAEVSPIFYFRGKPEFLELTKFSVKTQCYTNKM